MTLPPALLPPAFLNRPIAHRALNGPGRPENSRAAVRAAVARGYGIELDLQLSADGVPMVFHDEELDRLTGIEGPLAARTAAELGALPLRGGDEGVPTLAEVLAGVGGRVPLLIEVKDQDGMMGPRVGALEAATARVLKGYDGPVAVMSFNPHSVLAMRDLAPGVPRGLTTCAFDPDGWAPLPPEVRDRLREIPDYEAAGASFISHEARDLARPRVAELKRAGAAILCWTIRSPEAERVARAVAHNVTFEGYLA
jgi:glycerophosphoryl diester phosphodiesterase